MARSNFDAYFPEMVQVLRTVVSCDCSTVIVCWYILRSMLIGKFIYCKWRSYSLALAVYLNSSNDLFGIEYFDIIL